MNSLRSCCSGHRKTLGYPINDSECHSRVRHGYGPSADCIGSDFTQPLRIGSIRVSAQNFPTFIVQI